MLNLVKDSLTPFLDSFEIQFDKNKVDMIVPNPNSIKSIRKNEILNFIVFLKEGFE